MDIERLQHRLGVTADGIIGRQTYTELFRAAGCQSGELAADLGAAAALCFANFGITTELRLSHFLSQAAHETQGFAYLKELGGPVYFTRLYEGRKDLGNKVPGDGARFCGRGIFQLTGRANYTAMSPRVGADLVAHPERAADPAISLKIACLYWTDRKMNALADRDDAKAITLKINGGVNGLADRLARLAHMKALFQ